MSLKQYILSLPSCMIYGDDDEYRNKIRRVFQFDPNEKYDYDGKITDFNILDAKTKNELFFDSKHMAKNMDQLYEDTKDDSHFKELYLAASGRMFSTDPKIGQAVLCSYDTFSWYYSCVWYFYLNGVSGLLACSAYKNLKSYFNR